ncbi:MAG: polysaccharide export protein EpsE [Steroidobacteraceae bacterium]
MALHRWLTTLLLILATALGGSALAQDKPGDYRLGDGDNIRITVFQNPDLTLETRVSETGTITFPLIGSVKIGGLTIAAAAQTIASALQAGNFIQKPQVNIQLIRNLGNQVSVLGQVGRPGRFPLETFSTRLSEMLAIAGGISPTGADVAIVTGTREGKPFRKEVDIVGMFLDNRLQDDLIVAGGDVIYVQRQPMFYIYGEVQRPGSYRIERGMTIRQALVQGGGLTARGTERNLSVYRRGADGTISSSTVDLNDQVQANDVFHVRESLF